MTDKKEVKVVMNNGMVMRIPQNQIQQIVLPNIFINRSYFRLVLSMSNYNRTLADIRRRFKI